MSRFWRWFWGIVIGGPLAVFVVWAIVTNERLFFVTLLNGLTLASLYFIVAAGFTLVFGLMRNVNLVFAVTFAIGAGLAGFGGVIGAVELSMAPGEDVRLLLASLVVVIVGGMGSVVGAGVGAIILGLAETYGLAYAPTYSVVFTFVILILVLAFRPRGIMGRAA